MGGDRLRTNPHAVPRAPIPMIGRYRVNGTTLYAEVRGNGPPILIVPGGAEDAEGWRPVAERLAGHTVVTYDRRGTLRSGREGWPGRGSSQHADDAAALLGALGMRGVLVFGGSSAGIVAVQLALRHPALVWRALVFEPGYLRCSKAGMDLRGRVSAAMEAHLEGQPGDWLGAYRVFVRSVDPDPAAGRQGLTAPPAGLEWYAQREELNAEAFVRDDASVLTAESVDERALGGCPVDLRFSHGSETMAVFREIVLYLAAVRGAVPDVIDGASHAIYHHPDLVAAYVQGLTAVG